jgi:hypothetical protein
LDLKEADEEIKMHYSKAHPEVQEYVRMTARTFGRDGLWLNEDAFAGIGVEIRSYAGRV